MFSRNVLAFLAVTSLATLATAILIDLENINYSDEVEKEINGSLLEIPEQRRKPRLFNIPGKVIPFCTSVVGTVQKAPKICNSVSGFIVDATTSACRESFREICRLAIGTSYGCQPIINKICPSRAAVEKNIKQNVHNFCENSIQKVVNQFGRVASNVDKEAVCNAFVEVVRQTCRDTITKYCGDLTDLFQTPCNSFLPGIVCD